MTKRDNSGGLTRVGEIGFLKENVDALNPKESPGDAPAIPTAPEFQNRQLSLFQSFLYNRDEERDKLSNIIDLWDSVPRYSVSRQAMHRSRVHGSILKKHSSAFHYMGRTFTCTITPARVTDIDGEERDYYPSATEELVEDALRKIATDQQAGFFDKPNYRSGVVFSLYAVREELKKRGHARSYQEVRISLDILSGSIIEIGGRDAGKGGEAIMRSAYLPSVIAVSRAKLDDDPKAKWAVQFHPLVTGSIDKVTYRQFNYDLMMSHTTQLARWLHKQLLLKYTFADYTKPFEMRYSTVKRDSGLLDGYTRERAAIEALENAFADLKSKNVLSSYERNDTLGPRKKLLEVTFKIFPSFDFVREMKASNKRLSEAQRKDR